MFVNFFTNNEDFQRMVMNLNPSITDFSIFSDPDKLEEFLTEAGYGDSFGSSIDSSQLIFEDGQFVSDDSYGEDNQAFAGMFNDLLQDNTVMNIVDVDSNGSLSMEEINDFLDAVEDLDGMNQDISVYDVVSALNSIQDGTFASEESNETPDLEDSVVPIEESHKPERAKDTGRTGGRNGSKNGGSSIDVGESSSSNAAESVSIDQLQSDLKIAQKKVTDAQAGNTDAIKSAQEDCDAKKLAYEQALENDENISDDLLARQQENQANIDSQTAVVNEVKVKISENEDAITSQQATITSDKSDIDAIKKSISDLKSQTSEDPAVKKDIADKLSAANSRLTSAEGKLKEDEQKLKELEETKTQLEKTLTDEEETLAGYETTRGEIEAEILANCAPETQAALDAFKAAEEKVKSVQETEIANAKQEEKDIQAKIDKLNAEINAQNAKNIEKEFSINSLGNPEQLYKNMGLDEKGLNYDVFLMALEGYENLTDEQKATGYLGIFDTTQSSNKERYYLLDLNNFELVGQSVMKIGSGNMDNIKTANKHGSHATLSGFEQVGKEYYSNSMGKKALRLIGLEEGINDNAYEKGTVVHYTVNEHTWGCKGFPPVRTNGRIDKEATYEYMRDMFPTGAIIFTYPTDDRYSEYSDLVA